MTLSTFVLAAVATPVIIPAPQQYVAGEGNIVVTAEELTVQCATITRDAKIPKEGYTLSVSKDGIKVASSDDAGAFYAIETLKQMAKKTETIGYSTNVYEIACGSVVDAPKFKWRGVHFDDCRHFFGKEVAMRTLDLMAMHKLNVFHWHLTDDQGWRIDVPSHPELVKYGSVRPCSPKIGHPAIWIGNGKCILPMNNVPYGPYYYTRADLEEVVAYAKARHITVVPEIEIPGHAYALLAAHPEFACFPETIKRHAWTQWGIIHDVLCVGNPEAIKLFEDIFDYVCEVFPSPIIHIGGDECPRGNWEKCPKCQAFMKANNIKDVNGIQNWVTRHFADYLGKKGRRILGWDEILAGDVPKSAMGMCWRTAPEHGAGTELVSGAAGAVAGHDMVMTPSEFCYFDYAQGMKEDDACDIYEGNISLEKVYSFDPCNGVPEEAQVHVLGGQCNNWSEYTWSHFDLDWKMWPRTAALAEVLWTAPAKPRNYSEFAERMAVHRQRLLKLGVNCAPFAK